MRTVSGELGVVRKIQASGGLKGLACEQRLFFELPGCHQGCKEDSFFQFFPFFLFSFLFFPKSTVCALHDGVGTGKKLALLVLAHTRLPAVSRIVTRSSPRLRGAARCGFVSGSLCVRCRLSNGDLPPCFPFSGWDGAAVV